MNPKYKVFGIILLIGVLISLVSAAFGYYYLAPRYVDFDKYKDRIRSVFERRIVYPSELGNLNIELTWNFRARINADFVSIKKLNGNKFIELGPSYVEVPILPLASNRIILKKVNISILDADITRFDNGSFDVSSIIAHVEKPTYKVSVKDANIRINTYKLKFQDNLIQPAHNYLGIGEKIAIKDFSPDKYMQLHAEGKAFLDNEAGSDFNISFESTLPFLKSKKFHLAGKVKNLELNTITPYLDKKLTLQGKGDMNFDVEVYKKYFGRNKFFIDTVLDNLKIQTPQHGLISEHKGKLKVLARGYYNENLTVIDNLNIESADMDITSSGYVKKNDVALKLRLKNSQVQTIARLFPKIYNIKRQPFKKIIKHGIKAVISGDIKIKGNPKKPDIFGKMGYKNLFVLKNCPDTPKGFGQIDFVGPVLVLNNKTFVDKGSFTTVTGKVSPFKYKTIDINITSNDMGFNKASRIMFITQDFFRFKLGPVNYMDFEGMGRVNLNVTGKFGDAYVSGYVESKGLEVKYETLSKPAHDVTGRIIFTGDRVYYDELTAFSEGMKVLPSGYSTLKGYSDVVIRMPELDLKKGLNFVSTSPLLKEAKNALKEVLKADGRADASIHLKGTEDKLDSSGTFIFNNGYVLYRGFGMPFEKTNGVLKFKNEDVYFENLTGYIQGNKAGVSGFIKGNQDAELKIVSDSINLEAAKNFVAASPLLFKSKEVLDEYVELSGKSGMELNLKGNLEGDPFQSLTLKNMDGTFTHEMTGIPVYLDKGVLKITADRVDAWDVEGITEGINFKTNGSISNIKDNIAKNEPLIPDFRLEIPKFDFSKFLYFVRAPLTPPDLQQIFYNFDEFHGVAAVDIQALPEEWELNIVPINVSAVYQPYDVFVLFNSGSAKISNKGMDFSSLRGVISESTFTFNGVADKDKFDLTTNFNINSNDISKFRFYSDIPLIASGIIPLTLDLKGKPEDWSLLGRMLLEKGTYLSYFTDIGLPRDQVRFVNIEAQGIKDRVNINRLGFDIGDKNLVSIYGTIDKIKSSKPIFKDFVIKTNAENPINTNLFNPSIGTVLNTGCQNFFSTGVFKADLKMNGYVASPNILGSIVFQDVTVPDYQSHVELVSLNFTENQSKIDINGLNIGESSMNIRALTDNKLESPLHINDLQINSSTFNIDEMTKIFPQASGKEPGILPPFVITNGGLTAGEMIIRDLITSNVKASFNFTPDWLISIPKISFIATNGIGKGSIFYNLKTTELSSSFNFSGMETNAIATTLLSLPNEVYGTVDGNVQFSTRGKNPQELIANSNGYAEFVARKGHFVRLGSLEHLLRAVNVLHGGLGGFNINNVIDLIAPQKTGHFEVLQGSVYARNGILYTDDMTSAGKNLSLFMSGRLDMLTNQANIQVLGKLSKKVVGKLGPIGSVSINQFIDYIPGLGFLPTTTDRKGVIDLIPGLSKIPGLELDGDDKYRRFVVQINGDLYEQSSVKSFRWIE